MHTGWKAADARYGYCPCEQCSTHTPPMLQLRRTIHLHLERERTTRRSTQQYIPSKITIPQKRGREEPEGVPDLGAREGGVEDYKPHDPSWTVHGELFSPQYL